MLKKNLFKPSLRTQNGNKREIKRLLKKKAKPEEKDINRGLF
jgi:hypothetical protein